MRSFLLLCAVLVSGCAKTYVVQMSSPEKDAHYVLVQAGAQGAEKVYDCLSRPDGKNWEPTCVKAKMMNSAPGKEEKQE